MKIFKNFFIKTFIILLLFTILFSFSAFVMADEISNEVTADVAQDVILTYTEENNEKNSSIFINQSTVTIDYPVYGNAFIIGNNVTINNIINGSLFILADKVTLSESAESNTTFIMASDVTIDGYVGDLFCKADTLNINKNGYIYRDLYCFVKNFNLLGYIVRDAHISSSNVNITDEYTTISGDFYCSADKQIDFSNLQIEGNVSFTINSFFDKIKDIIVNLINTIIYSLVVIVVIIFIFKKFLNVISEKVEIDLGETILYGAISLIAIPLISIILLATRIASLLGLILLAVYLLILSVSFAISGLALGKIVYDKISKNSKKKSNFKLILISIAIIAILKLLIEIPYVGIIIFIANIILGSGIILSSIKSLKK